MVRKTASTGRLNRVDQVEAFLRRRGHVFIEKGDPGNDWEAAATATDSDPQADRKLLRRVPRDVSQMLLGGLSLPELVGVSENAQEGAAKVHAREPIRGADTGGRRSLGGPLRPGMGPDPPSCSGSKAHVEKGTARRCPVGLLGSPDEK